MYRALQRENVENDLKQSDFVRLMCCRLTYSQVGTESLIIIILYPYTHYKMC